MVYFLLNTEYSTAGVVLEPHRLSTTFGPVGIWLLGTKVPPQSLVPQSLVVSGRVCNRRTASTIAPIVVAASSTRAAVRLTSEVTPHAGARSPSMLSAAANAHCRTLTLRTPGT